MPTTKPRSSISTSVTDPDETSDVSPLISSTPSRANATVTAAGTRQMTGPTSSMKPTDADGASRKKKRGFNESECSTNNKRSKPARTRLDDLNELIESLEGVKVSPTPGQDFLTPSTAEELVEMLPTMEKPILIPSDSALAKQYWRSNGIQNVDSLMRKVLVKSSRKISVQDLATESGDTVTLTVEEVCRAFKNKERTVVYNCLDIGSGPYGIYHAPRELSDHNILLGQQANKDASRGEVLGGKDWRQFFLASMQRAKSPIHIDAGGVGTWFQGLWGGKDLYIGKPVWKASEGDLQKLASGNVLDGTGYSRGFWVKFSLQRGDIFIMPPGTPHAVATTSDAVFVGGFYQNRNHIPQILDAMDFVERYPDITNDEPLPMTFDCIGRAIDSDVEFASDADRLKSVLNSLTKFSKGPVPKPGPPHLFQSVNVRKEWCTHWQGFVQRCARWVKSLETQLAKLKRIKECRQAVQEANKMLDDARAEGDWVSVI